MRKIGDIHVFEDRTFQRRMVRASVLVCVLGVAVAILWALLMGVLAGAGAPVTPFELTVALGDFGARLMGVPDGSYSVNPFWWLSLALVMVGTLALHELVHAFFFKQYAPPGARVTFGANLKLGMIYASAEGIVYPRAQYMAIALAPSIVVTLLLLAIGMGLKWPLWTIILATVHLSGCTGDWGYVRALLQNPTITHCEDTDYGVCFYGDDVPTFFEVVDGGKDSAHEKGPAIEKGSAGERRP